MTSETTRPEQFLGLLVSANVLVERDDGASLTLSDQFTRMRADARDTLNADGVPDAFADVDVANEDLLADAMAIREHAEDVDPETASRLALSLRRIESPPQTEGVPDGFTPLLGVEIEPFLLTHDAAVLYFWREDCNPCDLVRRDFENAIEVPDDVSLGAVYGPECADLIEDEYGVSVAPTLLFCVKGRVDSRLVDAHPPDTVQKEISIITDQIR